MSITLLTNETTSHTWQTLDRYLDNPDILTVRLALSYLMKTGAQLVRRRLTKLISDGVPVEIVFGDDMGISDSQALTILSDIGCSLFVYRGTRRSYHPKMWLVDHLSGNRTVYVGSSNLSQSGLQTGVEAGIIIQGTADDTQNFQELWVSIRNASQEVDDEFIASYKTIEDENKIKFKLKADGRSDHKGNSAALEAFITGWMQYIEYPKLIGRAEKWRGWYLLPSHGVITIDKLQELRRVLSAIARAPQYRQTNSLDISPTSGGINNVNRILKNAGITYESRHAKSDRRALFVRQQKNYLMRLGFIEELGRHRVTITSHGHDLLSSSRGPQLRGAFSHSLTNIFWPHGNICFYPFLLDLINRLPGKRMYQSEVDLFLIHTYNASQKDNRVEIINMFRSLPVTERERLYRWTHDQLSALLSLHRNASAHDHYRGKVSELMVAFGCTAELKYIETADPMTSYLVLRN